MRKMERHNTDIAACANDRCEVRLKCLRWQLGTNKDPYQVYLIDNCNKNKCKEFIKSE